VTGAFLAFRGLVLDNPMLFDQLCGLDREDFIQTALRIAAQANLRLDRDDLEAAMAEARAEWRCRLL